MTNTRHNLRDISPPTGTEITTKSWLTEAPMRMLMNNLHPDVAETVSYTHLTLPTNREV